MNIRYYLRPADKDNKFFYVFADFRFQGERLRVSTQIQVEESKWDGGKEELKGRSPEITKWNTLLGDIKSRAGKWESDKITDRSVLDSNDLKSEILKLVNPTKAARNEPVKEEKITDLYSYLQIYIKDKKDNKELSSSSIKACNWFNNKIMTGFVEKEGLKAVMFDNIDDKFEKNLGRYIDGKKYSNGTHGKCFKIIKTLMKASHKDKLHTNMLFIHFERKREVPKTLALTENQIQQMYNLQLSDKLEEARDLFILSYCCGGMRVSDGLDIKPGSWKGDFFEYKAKKTENNGGDWITLPLRKESKAILKKYNGVLPTMAEVTYNKKLKKICVLIT
jgi:hypothetical protein